MLSHHRAWVHIHLAPSEVVSATLQCHSAWILSITVQPLFAGEGTRWAQLLGPDGQAVQEAASQPSAVSLEKSVRWKLDLSVGHSSPCLWDEVIFLTAYQSEGNVVETLCIDTEPRDSRSRKPCPEAEQIEKCHQVNNPAAPTPATDGKTVDVYFGSYGLLAYDFEGNELQHPPLPMARVFMNYGSGSSPMLARSP
jgi:hypothetical protein